MSRTSAWASSPVVSLKRTRTPSNPHEYEAAGRRCATKVHYVPFGEYVPLRDVLPWLKWFAPYDYDYSIRPGDRFTRFALGGYRFGVLICYEDTDPDLASRY